MTKQEAIEVLSEIRSGYNCFDESERRFYEALSVAIEALICSEKPNRSDVISRQDAIDVVKGIDSYFVKYIEELPSTQPSDDYNRGWHDGQQALREEIWEYERDRLD